MVDNVRLYFGNQDFQKIRGNALTWSPTPQFGSCKIFFLDLDLMKTKRLIQIFIEFKKKDKNIMLTILDRERGLIKRGLKVESDTYEGDMPIEFNPKISLARKYFITMKQTIRHEMESGINCKNYPFGDFSSYKDCDEDFVYNEMENKHKLMPFWAAKNLDEVTKLT